MVSALWTMIPAAVNLGTAIASRPKRKTYEINTDYIQRYINNLTGRRNDREVYNAAIQPALRNIGKQYGRFNRTISADMVRSGLSGSGIEAQTKLSAVSDQADKLMQASESASAQQLSENRRTSDMIDQAEMQKGAIKAQGRQAYRGAMDNWRTNLWGAGAGLATAGLSTYFQKLEETQKINQSKELAKKLGESFTGTESTGYEDVVQGLENRTINPGDVSQIMSERQRNQERNLSETENNISGAGNVAELESYRPMLKTDKDLVLYNKRMGLLSKSDVSKNALIKLGYDEAELADYPPEQINQLYTVAKTNLRQSDPVFLGLKEKDFKSTDELADYWTKAKMGGNPITNQSATAFHSRMRELASEESKGVDMAKKKETAQNKANAGTLQMIGGLRNFPKTNIKSFTALENQLKTDPLNDEVVVSLIGELSKSIKWSELKSGTTISFQDFLFETKGSDQLSQTKFAEKLINFYFNKIYKPALMLESTDQAIDQSNPLGYD